MFVPIEDARGSALVAVRASGVDPLSLTHPVAELIRREVPEATVSFRSLEQQVGDSVAQERIVATIASVFGMLALLLAGLGLYGVAAYSVNRRRAEIGIRAALGASPARVVRLVLMHLGWMVGAGLAGGAALSVWAGKFVTSLLYGLEPGDPVTLAGAAAVISVVTLLAGWLPARRAARIDPTVVLREG
jgi:ABC-type antimicrobial peptide transport system permease subunit